MPVYNGGLYLREAIQSILDQSYKNFELLILNDGSTDNSEKIIGEYKDARIIAKSQENQGLIRTLNSLIHLAKGTYIARMDPDDVMLPERIRLQVEYLNSHPNVGLVGSWIQVIDSNSDTLGTIKYPVTNTGIRITLAFRTAFTHGAVMLRRSLQPVYSLAYPHAEDFELWCRLLQQTYGANIPQVLYQWRFHASSTSNTLRTPQGQMAKKIKKQYGKALLQHPPAELTNELAKEVKYRGIWPQWKFFFKILLHYPFLSFTRKFLFALFTVQSNHTS